MLTLAYRLLATCVALFVAEWLVPGLSLTGGWWHLVWIGAVYGLLNATVKPIITFFAKPAIVLTLGLFYLVINAFMLWLTDVATMKIAASHPSSNLPMLSVDSVLAALLGSLIISVVNWLLTRFLGSKKD